VQRTAAETRAHLLDVANDLFYWNGIRAVGVDRVAAEAGVAPTTLYRTFGSKDGLIAAYIERSDRLYRSWFAAAATGVDPRARILAVFDALGEQVAPGKCRGCPFLMALAEFPDPEHPAHRGAVAAKTWTRGALGRLAADYAAEADSEALADQLSLLMEGVYASVQALGAHGPARRVQTIVAALLPAGR
jgi:AcrR family transcriptional regulator